MVDYTTITFTSSSFNLSHKVLHQAHDIDFSWICHKIQWQLMLIIFTYQDFIQLSAQHEVIRPYSILPLFHRGLSIPLMWLVICKAPISYSQSTPLASIKWLWNWIPLKSQLNFHVLPIKSNDIIHTVKFSDISFHPLLKTCTTHRLSPLHLSHLKSYFW